MNLKEIYEANIDVKESQIPTEWRKSFFEFIMGSTCLADLNEDGTVKDYIYYGRDFRSWYRKNKQSIERDIKIQNILK